MSDAPIREEAKAAFIAQRRGGERAPEPRQYKLAAGEMVTLAELKALERERPVPTPAPHLRPGGALETEVNAEVARANERRIRFIAARLQNQSQQTERAFRRAR
jgi:hypothetical protein